ncbi:MAG TPA: DUF1150 family protein [Stellaceae bacterium]|nr:DUF1150 family protein [Stellaceae bacterium]
MNRGTMLRAISPTEFAHFGLSDIAYVKRVIIDDESVFAVHAADGTPMAVLRDRETAVAALLQHELEAVSVH